MMFDKSIELFRRQDVDLTQEGDEGDFARILMWIGIFIGVVGVGLALTK
jgi:hypothetical protein